MTEAAAPKVTDYLLKAELRQPRTHVVADDLPVVGLRYWGRAELWQRKKEAEVLPCAIALLLLLRTVHSLKGGPNGCGLQLSDEEFAEKIGYSESQVHNAIRQSEADGYIVRFQQELPVSVLTKERKGGPADVLRRRHLKGTEERLHGKADAVAVTYLTPAGCRLVDSVGRTRAFLRVPTSSGRMERQAVATGLMKRLWKTLRHSLAAARCRVTAVRRKCTPYAARIKQKEVSSTTSCSSGSKLWETPTAATEGGEALAGPAISREGDPHGAQAPPSSAGTQAHAPPGSAEHSAHGTAPHTSRPGGGEVACPPVPESLVAGLPEALRKTFWLCWRRTVRVTKYRQPNKRFAGGDALVPDGEREVWAPAMAAAVARPNQWRYSSSMERQWLVQKFEPVRQALVVAMQEHERQKAEAREALEAAAAAAAARAAAAHELELLEVEALERKRRAQPGAGAW